MKFEEQPKWIQELIKEFNLDINTIHIDVYLKPIEPQDPYTSYFGDIYINVRKQVKNDTRAI